MPGIRDGELNWRLHLGSVIIILTDLERLRCKSLQAATVSLCFNSSRRVWWFDAGISSAYLHKKFPEVVTVRSEALTTYDAGPIAEAWSIFYLLIQNRT